MALAREARARGETDLYTACRRQVALLQAKQVITTIGRAIDDICYRGYRRTEIRQPVFIAAPARSGTTLLFNLMARDPVFSCMKTYQSQLPAISIEHAVRALARLDQPLHGGLRHLVDRLDAHTAGFEHLHRTRLTEPEEDSGLFLSALVEPNINMIFPFGHAMSHRWYLDDFAEPERTRIMDWYISSLKRHLYDASGRQLLVKNAHTAGRLASIRQTLPDVRVINIVRHPYDAVPSSVSLVANGYRTLTGREPDVSKPEWRAIADATIEYYLRLLRFERTFPEGQWATVRFDDLVRQPLRTVEEVYERLRMTMSPEAKVAISQEAHSSDRHRSRGHSYSPEQFGLTRETIAAPLQEIFDLYGFDP